MTQYAPAKVEFLDFVAVFMLVVLVAFGSFFVVHGWTDFVVQCDPLDAAYRCKVRRSFVLGAYQDELELAGVTMAALDSGVASKDRSLLSGKDHAPGIGVSQLGLMTAEGFAPLEPFASSINDSFRDEARQALNEHLGKKRLAPFEEHLKVRNPFGGVGFGLLGFAVLFALGYLRRFILKMQGRWRE